MANNHNFKTTNGLMNYMRTTGININGSHQKNLLINYGYYHGYKGYRFFHDPTQRIAYTDFMQLIAVIKYDNNIKDLFYSKLMYIETALKNISLEYILNDARTNEINKIFIKSMPGRRSAPLGSSTENKKRLEIKKQKCIHKIRNTLLYEYSKNNKIVSNFYDNSNHLDVPIWAVFEVITLGEFGNFISNLNKNIRKNISKNIHLDLSGDTNFTLLSDIIFMIKDLRNAVVHNDIIFDTRFRKSNISGPLRVCMTNEIGLPYANFKSLVDYVVLAAYLLKKLKVPKQQINSFINNFEKEIINLHAELPTNISNIIIHADSARKLSVLKLFIKS